MVYCWSVLATKVLQKCSLQSTYFCCAFIPVLLFCFHFNHVKFGGTPWSWQVAKHEYYWQGSEVLVWCLPAKSRWYGNGELLDWWKELQLIQQLQVSMISYICTIFSLQCLNHLCCTIYIIHSLFLFIAFIFFFFSKYRSLFSLYAVARMCLCTVRYMYVCMCYIDFFS